MVSVRGGVMGLPKVSMGNVPTIFDQGWTEEGEPRSMEEREEENTDWGPFSLCLSV